MRLDDSMLTNRRNYLDPINFATNFAFFRDGDGLHTRLVTANYWAGYGAERVEAWFCLFGAAGETLAAWHGPLPDGLGAVTIDSGEAEQKSGGAGKRVSGRVGSGGG